MNKEILDMFKKMEKYYELDIAGKETIAYYHIPERTEYHVICKYGQSTSIYDYVFTPWASVYGKGYEVNKPFIVCFKHIKPCSLDTTEIL